MSAGGSEAVEAYLAGVPEPAQTNLRKLRSWIRAAAPKEATELISYRMPALRYHGLLVSYCAFSKHCSLFPMSTAVMQELAEELEDWAVSKGTIRFPLDRLPPAALVKKIVKARVAENVARQEEAKKRKSS